MKNVKRAVKATCSGIQTRVCAVQGGQNIWILRKLIFWNDDKKRSEFDLGSAFFGISEVDFLPTGTE